MGTFKQSCPVYIRALLTTDRNTSKISSPKKLRGQKQPITRLNLSHNQEIPQAHFMQTPQQETSNIIMLQDLDTLVDHLANQSVNVCEKVFLVQENYGQNSVEEVFANTPVILATDTTDDKVTGSRTDNAIEGLVREKKRSNDLKEKLLEESRKKK
ncbi:hypothetical protein JTE90_001440 [Oedothorax gibbosus]|uniref:Uncharacterized protein n=1 Tax=Oedothorax gibbosus TaxID=931172 RepID=A0AAV6V0T6_9ARAC|nr:hypothetical protein JTE90_001440 [Oedothorax gibbosus]